MSDAWLGWLIAALALNAAFRAWSDWRHDRDMRKVLRVLIVWAKHWGEPPEDVKPHLLKALEDIHGHR